MDDVAELPGPVADALLVWLRHHDERSPGLIDGLHVVGSAALDDWRRGSDIDVVAVMSRIPTDRDVEALREAHDASVAEVPGVDVDGPRLLTIDVTVPPAPLVRPWTLHGDFHHDDGCFECNPVTWRSLATAAVTVRGRTPDELGVHDEGAAVLAFVQSNTEGYWRSVADAIDQALAADPDRSAFRAEMTSWSVLGPARMLYTARTGDIASKTSAGNWIATELPEFGRLAEHAISVRAGPEPPDDDRPTAEATAEYIRRVADLVASV